MPIAVQPIDQIVNDPGCPTFIVAPAPAVAFGDMAAVFGFAFDPNGGAGGAGLYTIPPWFQPIYNNIPSPLAEALTSTVIGILGVTGGTVQATVGAAGCNDANFAAPALASVALGLAEQWLGTNLPPLRINLDNQMNYYCPQAVPCVADANSCLLTDVISYDTWRCWVRTAGMHEDNAYSLLQAGRQQTPAQGIVRLKWKGAISAEDCYWQLSGQGFSQSQDQDMLEESMRYVVPPSDLIRMMVRDTFDPVIVESYNLSSEFPDKYQGQAKQIAAANGISDDDMLRYWQAHWQMPSAGQLYQMYFRLRPEVVTVDDPDVFTFDDLQTALAVNDISPHWRSKFSRIASNVVTRVDGQRMYFADVWTEDDLWRAYLKEGYTAEDASSILQWQIYQKRQWLYSQAGDYNLGTIATLYKEGVISRSEMTSRLLYLGYNDTTTNESISVSEMKRDDENRRRTIDGIRRMYLKWRLDNHEVITELVATGMDSDQAIDLKDAWEYQLHIDDHQPGVRELCNWFKDGLIEMSEYQERLRRIGYTGDDQGRAIKHCATTIKPPKGTKPKPVKQLTLSQLCAAVAIGDMEWSDYLTAVEQLGYSARDAAILKDACATKGAAKPTKPPKPPPKPKPPKPPKRPSDKELCDEFVAGVTTWDQYVSGLTDNGYSDGDAYNLASSCAEKAGITPPPR